MDLEKAAHDKISTDDELSINLINQSSQQESASLTSTHSINADTGTTGNFISLPDSDVLLNITPTNTGIVVSLPNGDLIRSTHTATLNLPSIPMSARAAHIFPGLTGSLLSIGLLTDAGLTAVYTADAVVITDQKGIPVLSGKRSPTTRLWMIDLPGPSVVSPPDTDTTDEVVHYTAAVIRHENDSHLVNFYHTTLGSPAISTFIGAASRGYLTCFPQLTVQKIRRNKPHTVATSMGHLDQTRKNYKSTKKPVVPSNSPVVVKPSSDPSATLLPPAEVDDIFPVSTPAPTHTVYTRIHQTHQNYMDGTGRFPVRSRSGNESILIMYNYDANYIHCEPMRRGRGRLIDAYKHGHAFFKARGFQPKYERLDNETSKELEDFMKLENISFQYVPPRSHRRNAAERSIRTFKNHFVATLCTVDKAFPLQLWDAILPQTELTLNLLRGSRLDPSLSAWAQLHGAYDFNAHPIAPVGMRIVLHEKPGQRATWAPHGVEGFYLGPALEHYRCYRGWVISTQRERVVDTVAWHPTTVHMPGSSERELLTKAIKDLQGAIIAHSSTLPSTQSPSLTELHQQLATLFPDIPPHPPSDLQRLTQDIQRSSARLSAAERSGPAAHDSPDKDAAPPVSTPTMNSPGGEQRVDRAVTTMVGDQRVDSSILSDNSPSLPPSAVQTLASTKIPFSSISLPGRVALVPGGDNITYARMRGTTRARPPQPSCTTPPPESLLPANAPTPHSITTSTTPPPGPATHVGEWKVLRVVQHRGKASHRSKLQFRVQWCPNNGIVSPDTWIPWTQAKPLLETMKYIQTVPLLHYLLQFLPARGNNTALSAAHYPRPPLSAFFHSANSTTGSDGQPLRYNKLMKGPEATDWIEAHACEFDRLLTTTKTMHFIHSTDKPPERLASYYNPQCSIKNGTDKRVRGTYGGDRTDYAGDVSANTASLETVMVMLNATVV